MKNLIIILSLVLFFANCGKDETPVPKKNPPQNPPPPVEVDEKEALPKLSIIDIRATGDQYWHYLVLSDSSDYFLFNTFDSRPNVVFYHATNGKEFSVLMNDEGLPERVMTDDYIFLFSNFNGKKVDIGIIYPDGKTEIIREVVSGINWEESAGRIAKTEDWKSIIKWTGRIVGAIPCATSIAATVSTAGAAWPTILKTCLPYALSLAANIMEDKGKENGFTGFMEKYDFTNFALDCANINIDCFKALVSKAVDAFIVHFDKAKEKESLIDNLGQRLLNPNSPPKASFNFTPSRGTTETEFSFNSSGSSDAEDFLNLQYRWDWETDGFWDTEFSYEKITHHKYDSPGLFQVTLEVKDSHDSTAQISLNVLVEKVPEIELEGQIVFTSFREWQQEIYKMDANGTNLENLTSDWDHWVSKPFLLPDGSGFLFSSETKKEIGDSDLFYQKFGSSERINLTNTLEEDESDPSISDDLSRLVYSSRPFRGYFPKEEESEIFIMNLNDNSIVQLTENSYLDFFPIISPDGTKIAFISKKDGNKKIYLMNSDGTNVIKLRGGNLGYDPSFSKDGRYLLFSSEGGLDDSDIYLTDLENPNNEPLNLTNTPYGMHELEPSFAGGGILFSARNNGNFDIYYMDLSTRKITQITDTEYNERNPLWKPN